jgi:hypothetical protein
VFARVLEIAGAPADIEAGAEVYRSQVLPWARDVAGFRGYIVLVDREEGRGLAMSLWATEQAMVAFEEQGKRFRGIVAETTGIDLRGVRSYEVAMLELSP